MKFVEASKFGGPEVLTLVEAPTPTPQEATLLVEVGPLASIMRTSWLGPVSTRGFRRPLSLWVLRLPGW